MHRVLLDFNPRAPCGARRRCVAANSQISLFQSTRPLRGATYRCGRLGRHGLDFNPRAPCGARPNQSSVWRDKHYFNPRAPCGARPHPPPEPPYCKEFQSTRPLRGATGVVALARGANLRFQSTRPLRGATMLCRRHGTRWDFNPRAPCGARRVLYETGKQQAEFQSTRPLRGATTRPAVVTITPDISIHAPLAGRDVRSPVCPTGGKYFNPRAPCGARLSPMLAGLLALHISIHAPLAGRDRRICAVYDQGTPFQSTRPLRGATERLGALHRKPIFQSTRPLRGATPDSRPAWAGWPDFNPRAPCGARRFLNRYVFRRQIFQSTRPLRGATHQYRRQEMEQEFQSTRPLRGATEVDGGVVYEDGISIHAPLAGRDWQESAHRPNDCDFNPRAPCGARLLR